MVTMTTVSFYLITAYNPHLRNSFFICEHDTWLVTLCSGRANLFWLRSWGALSDRIGRRPLLLVFTILMRLQPTPRCYGWFARPTFSRLLAVELCCHSFTPVITRHGRFPHGDHAGRCSYSGFSLAYSLGHGCLGVLPPDSAPTSST